MKELIFKLFILLISAQLMIPSKAQAIGNPLKTFLNVCNWVLTGEKRDLPADHIQLMFVNRADTNLSKAIRTEAPTASQRAPFLTNDDMIEIRNDLNIILEAETLGMAKDEMLGTIPLVFVFKLGNWNTLQEALKLFIKLTYLYNFMVIDPTNLGLTTNANGDLYSVHTSLTGVTPIKNLAQIDKPSDHSDNDFSDQFVDLARFLETRLQIDSPYLLVGHNRQALLKSIENNKQFTDQELIEIFNQHTPKIPYYNVVQRTGLHFYPEDLALTTEPLQRQSPSAKTGYGTLLTLRLLLKLPTNGKIQVHFLQSLPEGNIISKQSLSELVSLIITTGAANRKPYKKLNTLELISFLKSKAS